MAVTIKQIAEKSGVSRGTVDRVLNHRGNVNPDTERVVKRVAEELGYRPNIAGKALAARKKKYNIGVILCSQGNEFFDDVYKGLHRAENEALDYGVTVLFRTLKGYDVERQIELIDELKPQIHFLILNAIDDWRVIRKIDELYADNIEVITLNTDISGKRLCHVGCNYKKSGETAAGMMGLITGGRAKIGVATGFGHLIGHNQRLEGFRSVCEKRYPEMEIVGVIETKDDKEYSYVQTLALLKEHEEITAFYAASSGVAGVCRAMEELGRSDIVVIACDYTESMKRLIDEGMVKATICQQPFTQGYKSLDIAVNYLVNGIHPYKEVYTMKNEIKIYENA